MLEKSHGGAVMGLNTPNVGSKEVSGTEQGGGKYRPLPWSIALGTATGAIRPCRNRYSKF